MCDYNQKNYKEFYHERFISFYFWIILIFHLWNNTIILFWFQMSIFITLIWISNASKVAFNTHRSAEFPSPQILTKINKMPFLKISSIMIKILIPIALISKWDSILEIIQRLQNLFSITLALNRVTIRISLYWNQINGQRLWMKEDFRNRNPNQKKFKFHQPSANNSLTHRRIRQLGGIKNMLKPLKNQIKLMRKPEPRNFKIKPKTYQRTLVRLS